MKVKLLLISIVVTLVLASVVSACPFDACELTTIEDPIFDPQPVLQIDYESPDVEVAIRDYSLERTNGVVYELAAPVEDTNKQGLYYFNVLGFLIDGEYSFVIDAEDADGNTRRDTFIFQVDTDEMPIWVSTPRIPQIEAKEQHVAVGTTLPFDIVINTELSSTCAIKNYLPSDTQLEKELLYSLGQEITTTPTNSHVIKAVDIGGGSEFSGLFTFEVLEFNHQNPLPYAVICRIPPGNINEPAQYALQEMFLGVDNSEPVFDATFTPELIDDRAEMLTTLAIDSQDIVFCELTPLTSNLLPELYSDISLFQDENELDPFSLTYDAEFDFQSRGGSFNDGQDYAYSFDIMCTNPSGLTSTITRGFNINLNSDLVIYLDDSIFGESQPTLPFRTSVTASCRYTDINGDNTQNGEITSTPTRNHPFTLPSALPDGDYQITIFCAAQGGTATASQTFDFVISGQIPSAPVLDMEQYLCGDDPEVSISDPDDLPNLRYDIELYSGSSTSGSPIDTDSTTGNSYTTNVVLSAEAMYTYSVVATSPSDLSSSAATVTFQNTEDTLLCDDGDPTVDLTTSPAGQGYNVEVTCTDTQGTYRSGCDVSGGWKYELIELGADCPETLTQTQDYGSVLFVTTDQKICVEISDRSGRTATAEDELTVTMDIELISPQPFGIAQDNEFEFTVEPERTAICKFIATSPSPNVDLTPLYSAASFFEEDSGDPDVGYIPAETPADSFTITLDDTSPLFATNERASITVICNENGILSKADFEIGFDTTPPVITTVGFTFNPVTNPADLTTTINVSTNEPTICYYKSIDDISLPDRLRADEPFGEDDFDVEDNYKTYHEIELDYINYFSGGIDQQNITCVDRVGLRDNEVRSVIIEPEQGVGITLLSQELWGTSPVTFSIRTNAAALCEVSVEGGEAQELGASQGDLIHTLSGITLAPGKHKFDVSCINLITTNTGGASFTITYDNAPPFVDLYLNQYTCDLNTIKGIVDVSDVGSGIRRVNYVLSDGTGEVQSGNINPNNDGVFSIETDDDLQDNTAYTLQVTAVDESGLETSDQGTITAINF